MLEYQVLTMIERPLLTGSGVVRGEWQEDLMIRLRMSEHRTGSSEGAESRKAVSPWSLSILESIFDPLSQCLDGSGKAWVLEEEYLKVLGLKKELTGLRFRVVNSRMTCHAARSLAKVVFPIL